MSGLMQSIIYFIVLPIIYVTIIWFDYNLIRSANSPTDRLRMVISVFAGVLVSVIIISLDSTLNIFTYEPSRTIDIRNSWQFVVSSLFLGLFAMSMVHLFAKKNSASSFFVMFTVVMMIIVAYL